MKYHLMFKDGLHIVPESRYKISKLELEDMGYSFECDDLGNKVREVCKKETYIYQEQEEITDKINCHVIKNCGGYKIIFPLIDRANLEKEDIKNSYLIFAMDILKYVAEGKASEQIAENLEKLKKRVEAAGKRIQERFEKILGEEVEDLVERLGGLADSMEEGLNRIDRQKVISEYERKNMKFEEAFPRASRAFEELKDEINEIRHLGIKQEEDNIN
ncbi:hypothetical protein KY330_04290 [Candidatus Woesearchaeota archaeon]|nr:hypothetical protein [Candidatus Woesearchaeota archaeon]